MRVKPAHSLGSILKSKLGSLSSEALARKTAEWPSIQDTG